MTDFTMAELRRVISACLGADKTSAIDETSVDTEFEDLGLDSLAVYEVVTRLQDQLSITISDDEIDTMKTPGAVIEFVNGRLTELAR